MLPFGVNRSEQYRALQRTVAKAYLSSFRLVSKLPCERKLAKLNRHVPDLLSHRGFDGLDPTIPGILRGKTSRFRKVIPPLLTGLPGAIFAKGSAANIPVRCSRKADFCVRGQQHHAHVRYLECPRSLRTGHQCYWISDLV